MTAAGRGPRLQDVAEAAGVSIATASRALAGANGVSKPMTARVRAHAAELGYVPNSHARSLARGTSPTVGLIVHEIGDPYFTEVAGGVIEVASTHGLAVQICHSGRDPEVELAQIRALIADRTGSIIVAGSGHTDSSTEGALRDELERFRRDGGRVAMIGRHQASVDAVIPDNLGAGRTLTEHVLDLGHREIGIATGLSTLTTVADRLTGVHEAIEAHSRKVRTTVREAAFTLEGGRDAAHQILDASPEVTAVIALNDAMAIGVLGVLRERGIACPAEVSVVGFDDVAVSAYLGPPLTTVRMPMVEMGRLALEMTLQPITRRPRRRRTKHELVTRESAAPPPT